MNREPPGADRDAEPGAELDKIYTKFRFLRVPPDESRKSPCSKIAAQNQWRELQRGDSLGVAAYGEPGGGIIIAPEYKPAAGVCRSRGARKQQSAVSGQPQRQGAE